MVKIFSSLLALGKCFGDSSRIKIFYDLETFKEMCVCDLASVLNTSIAATSHHLRFLKKYGLTKSRQNGKVVYYSLSNEEVVTTIHAFLTISENVGVKS